MGFIYSMMHYCKWRIFNGKKMAQLTYSKLLCKAFFRVQTIPVLGTGRFKSESKTLVSTA